MKKVLMIGLSSNIGGVETSIINLIDNYKDENTIIDFINSSRKSLGLQSKLEKEYNIYKISNYYDDSEKYKKELENIIVKNNYDIIYINLCSVKHLEPIEVVSKYNSVKIIIHAHCIEDNSFEIKKKLTNAGDILLACSEEVGNSFFYQEHLKLLFHR